LVLGYFKGVGAYLWSRIIITINRNSLMYVFL